MWGALHGVPITLEDLHPTSGIRSMWGGLPRFARLGSHVQNTITSKVRFQPCWPKIVPSHTTWQGFRFNANGRSADEQAHQGEPADVQRTKRLEIVDDEGQRFVQYWKQTRSEPRACLATTGARGSAPTDALGQNYLSVVLVWKRRIPGRASHSPESAHKDPQTNYHRTPPLRSVGKPGRASSHQCFSDVKCAIVVRHQR